MNRQRRNDGAPGRPARLALTLGAFLTTLPLSALAQQPPAEPPGTAAVGTSAELGLTPEAAEPAIPADIQVVRFQAPAGARIELLGPASTPVPVQAGDTSNGITVGLKVGVGYRLRVSNYPTRPGAVLYPVVELVGHLHRPPGIDPAKYPIRVIFGPDDVEDIVARGRLVTQVVYLEDPDQALPLHLPREEIPTVTLSPAEEPLKVASALGRVMAIVRLGGRMPTLEESASGASDYAIPNVACPFTGPSGGRCALPCGPVLGTPPPAGRPWLPKDEFLCDGGDGATPAHFAGDGGLAGIDPRDAVLRFRDDRRPRLLPTNLVCIYAPRFAMVRASVGPNENTTITTLRGAETLQKEASNLVVQGPRRMTQNQAAEIGRHRARPSGLIGRAYAGSHIEVRVLSGIDGIVHIAGQNLVQGAQTSANREKPALERVRAKAVGIKTAESAVLTGIVQGAGEQVMAWKPQEMAGVEVPPNKPGMAVIKRVSAGEAEPGDVVTFSIQYRNMGNVPIREVTIVDSLLPRLEYVVRSARGPAGTVFTAAENKAGAMELRWDIGTLAPGAEGYVSFETKVR